MSLIGLVAKRTACWNKTLNPNKEEGKILIGQSRSREMLTYPGAISETGAESSESYQ